ncbi:protein adenylyltransferase SelO, mitochondrial [Aplysia californica]|uniref:Selenoprotein O n=1 Tax=Aplysia californica TaxID=6500 RepID=A0ABM0JVN9_APLCA|nr:protein adenylyltransferase SelO, mitochondrial [Aplysia californica]
MSRNFVKCCISTQRSPEHVAAFRGLQHCHVPQPGRGRQSIRSYSQSSSEYSDSRRSHHRTQSARNIICLAGYAVKRFVHKMAGASPTLETLNFDNLALKSLPVDPNVEKTQRQVPGACFSQVSPTPVKRPVLICKALPALALIDISEEESQRPEFVEYFSGNKILPGSETAAHCYCGHQFGYFSGQLGDGAAMYLGEIVNSAGKRWEIQLKGAGLTPYSRTADGRKVLRSTIREFLCSEAIYHLGIPTTRAGSCITSDSTVVRDIFYNGNPKDERCTLVLRIAPTFLRFGSFEIFKPMDSETGRQGPSVGRKDILTTMLDYTVKNFYPEIWASHSSNKPVMYVEFYKEVVRRTARLVADWQCVGWCHGVLNTDNMSIVGVTIDYGPYGFMDRYDPDFICNGSDDGGRYSYQKQPEMCRWNCVKLAEAIKDAVPLSETKPHIDLFDEEFGAQYKKKMRSKLGLQKEISEDGNLVKGFLDTLQETGADFTNCFRCLSNLPLPSCPTFNEERSKVLDYLISQSSSLDELKLANKPRMDKRQLSMFMMLAQTNPDLLSALGRSAQLLSSEMERMGRLQELQDTTAAEVEENNRSKWNEWLDKYSERLKKEEEGVEDRETLGKDRVNVMNSTNPRFILRNYIAQNAIAEAEKGNYSEVQRVLKLLQSPYSQEVDFELSESSKATQDKDTSETESSSGASACHVGLLDYAGKPPSWASELRVT